MDQSGHPSYEHDGVPAPGFGRLQLRTYRVCITGEKAQEDRCCRRDS